MSKVTEPESVLKSRLLLENELLTNEVRRLREDVAEARRGVTRHEKAIERLQADAAVGEIKASSPEGQALDDIRWLVNRLDRSPLGLILRSQKGFRVLKDRYGTPQRG